MKAKTGNFTDPSIRLAVRDMLIASVAMGTWGLVTGIAMVQSGLSTWQAVGMSLMVYAGSAQLASLPLFAAGSPLVIIWASAIIVNLRFVIYSVAMKPYFKGLSAPRKGLMGVGVTDVLAADFLRRFTVADVAAGQKDPERLQPLRYFSWGAMTIWMVWQSASMLGIALAHLIPPDWGLEFIATLALFAMLMPMMTDRASMLCVLVAGAVSLVFVQLPLNLGLLISVVLGVAAAMLVDSRRGRPKGLSS